MGKSCCAIGCCNQYSKKKAVECVSIDSPKVNPSGASGLLLSEERNRNQLNTLGCVVPTLLVGKKVMIYSLLTIHLYSIFSFTHSPLERKSKQKLGVTHRLQHSQAVAIYHSLHLE